MTLLSVEGLSVELPDSAGPLPLLSEVSFSLSAGQCLALVGESGCGKSVTALALLRLLPRPLRVSAGRVLLEGVDLLSLPIPELRRLRGSALGMIFQEPMTSLHPVIQVGAQVVEALQLHEKVSRKAAEERVLSLFERVGIPEPRARLRAYPHQLSGGLKQRVMIAMAVALRPRVLLCDEPTTALDVTIQAQILELLRELLRDGGTSVLLITHDLGVVNQLADEVAVMYAGRVVERAQVEQLLRSPAHPYSQGLLAALPGLAAHRSRLREIPGTVPLPRDYPVGCRFAPRCALAEERCQREVPSLTPLALGQEVSCFVAARSAGGAS